MNKIVWLIILSWLITACTSAAATPTAFPRQVVASPDECYDPSAAALQETPGWTWFEITTGVSTEQDLLSKFGEPTSVYRNNTRTGQFLSCHYNYRLPSQEVGETEAVTFWLSGNKLVIAITLSKPEEHLVAGGKFLTLSEAKSAYGRPEMVGWSPGLVGYRATVWLSQGVAGIAFVGKSLDTSGVPTLTYFTPLSEQEFAQSPLSDLIQFSRPEGGDVIDSAPQDPFQW